MLALKIFLIACLIGSIIWAIFDTDYQSVTAVIITAGCLLAVRANARAQKDKRTYQPEKTHDKS